MADTECRQVEDFPAYSVDASGVVYRQGRTTPLAQCCDKKGYLAVNLSQDGISTRRTVHRVVLEAFVGKRPEGHQGCHLDGDKKNNAISNLKWGTVAENESHKAAHGTKAIGVRNGWHKLSEWQVQEIRKRKACGLKEWGATKTAKEFGVNLSTIFRAATGRYWGHLESNNE